MGRRAVTRHPGVIELTRRKAGLRQAGTQREAAPCVAMPSVIEKICGAARGMLVERGTSATESRPVKRPEEVAEESGSEESSPEEGKFFNGDIDAFIDRMRVGAERQTTSPLGEADRLAFWAILGIQCPSFLNRHMAIKWEVDLERHMPRGGDQGRETATGTSRMSTKTKTSGDDNGKGRGDRAGESDAGSDAEDEHRRGRRGSAGLRRREGKMAQLVRSSAWRTMDLLAACARNRACVCAVASALVRLGLGDGV